MLYLPKSKFHDTVDMATAAGVVFAAEGGAVVRAAGAQSAGVMPSTGAATDVFQGIAVAGTSAAPFAEGYATKVQKFVVGVGGSVTLDKVPVTGQLFVFDHTAGAADATFANAAGTKVVTGLTAGNEVTLTYKYALSVVEARAIYGDTQPGGYAGAYVSQIGVIRSGDVYTDQFDASVDWTAATAIKLKANGIFTDQSGTGVVIDAAIISAPGVDTPFLGLHINE